MKKVLFILSELDDEDINWLIQVGSKQDVSAGTILIHEGKPVDTLYILLEGTLVVSISAMTGREVARLSSGEVVGEMSFVDSRPPSATVQTLENCLVLSIPRTQLAEKLKQDIAFGCRFYRALAIMLSHRLRGTVKQLGEDKDKPAAETNGVDPGMAETVAVAQARFDDMLARLKSQ
ncbi:cyclic nucleotide-binding domain-containing protein [Oscillatoria sp. FACHB-1407]|uniref:cyclic nucleotide-binding domain-containing protein n=1 Tax=Oscillatoria sp. FACHB-1407 TaxID=2692847 RepID=UPI001684FE11|nr:cyclic nucleotide-binding domain-containing protein [Oscillatoria sp. FACHB-1407]MBD2464632.1 cyclic nucleotide-binding domain-containing protein [Oscillatoria sp. FACHB-1407]